MAVDEFDPAAFGISLEDNSGVPANPPSASGDGDGGDEPVTPPGPVVSDRDRLRNEFTQGEQNFLRGIIEAAERGEIDFDHPDSMLKPVSQELQDEVAGLADTGRSAGDGEGGRDGQPQSPVPPTDTGTQITSTPQVTSVPPVPQTPPVDGAVDLQGLANRVTGSEAEAAQMLDMWRRAQQGQFPQPQQQYPPQQTYAPQPQQQYIQQQYQPQPQAPIPIPGVDPEISTALQPVVQSYLNPLQQQIADQQETMRQMVAMQQQQQRQQEAYRIGQARDDFWNGQTALTPEDKLAIEDKLIRSGMYQAFYQSSGGDAYQSMQNALDYAVKSDPNAWAKVNQAAIEKERQQQIAEQKRQQTSTALSGGGGAVPHQQQQNRTNGAVNGNSALVEAVKGVMGQN